MSWYIIEISVNLFQFYMIYKIFDLYYEQRYKFKYSIEVTIVIMTLLLSLLNNNISLGSSPFLYIGFYCYIYVTTLLLFKGNFLIKSAVFFSIIVILGICELLSGVLISSISGISLSSMLEQNFGRFEVMIISQTVFFLLYLVMKARKKNNKILNRDTDFINTKYYLHFAFILFLTIFVIVIVVSLYGKFNVDLNYINEFLVFLTISVILISITAISLTNCILQDMSEKHKNEIELRQIKLENKYFEDVNKTLEEIRILRHDMRGELAILHGYNELNQRDKIRSHIEKKLGELEVQLVPQIDKDNVITPFLNFKVNEAKSKGINVEVQSYIDEDSIIEIDKEDICRIINNIMNNAIEANTGLNEKYIKIEFNVEGDNIFIEAENPFNGILTNGDTILTKKQDKTQHGFGLKSIKNIAEKYDGHMFIDYEDNVFIVEVNLLNKNTTVRATKATE